MEVAVVMEFGGGGSGNKGGGVEVEMVAADVGGSGWRDGVMNVAAVGDEMRVVVTT
nr:hypothetical protein [Tanacetum cinerariifolium]